MSIKLKSKLTTKITMSGSTIGEIKIDEETIFGKTKVNNTPSETPSDDKPNNEIWYKTSDNQPVEIYDGLDWGTNEILSNEYDPEDDCCKIVFKEDVTEIPDGDNSDEDLWEGFMYIGTPSGYGADKENIRDKYYLKYKTITEIVHFPKTITKIGKCSFGGTSISNINFLHENINEIKDYFFGYTGFFNENITIDLTKLNKNINGFNYFLSCPECHMYSGTYAEYYLNNFCNIKNINIIGEFPEYITLHGFCQDFIKLESIDLTLLSKITSIDIINLLIGCISLKTIIINNSNKVLSSLLKQIKINSRIGDIPLESIYVNDNLLEEYKETVPEFADKFKPLSEYSM